MPREAVEVTFFEKPVQFCRCGLCGHEWQNRVNKPRQCPRCLSYLKVSQPKESIEVL